VPVFRPPGPVGAFSFSPNLRRPSPLHRVAGGRRFGAFMHLLWNMSILSGLCRHGEVIIGIPTPTIWLRRCGRRAAGFLVVATNCAHTTPGYHQVQAGEQSFDLAAGRQSRRLCLLPQVGSVLRRHLVGRPLTAVFELPCAPRAYRLSCP